MIRYTHKENILFTNFYLSDSNTIYIYYRYTCLKCKCKISLKSNEPK